MNDVTCADNAIIVPPVLTLDGWVGKVPTLMLFEIAPTALTTISWKCYELFPPSCSVGMPAVGRQASRAMPHDGREDLAAQLRENKDVHKG